MFNSAASPLPEQGTLEAQANLAKTTVTKPPIPTETPAPSARYPKTNALTPAPLATVRGTGRATIIHELADPAESHSSYRLSRPVDFSEQRCITKMAAIVSSLRDSGYPVADLLNMRDDDERTALDVALDANRPKVASWLLNNGADPRTSQTPSAFLTRVLETLSAPLLTQVLSLSWVEAVINTQNEPDGDMPLHVACEHLSLPMVDILLQKGANPTSINSEGLTPLQVTARQADLLNNTMHSGIDTFTLTEIFTRLSAHDVDRYTTNLAELGTEDAHIQECYLNSLLPEPISEATFPFCCYDPFLSLGPSPFK